MAANPNINFLNPKTEDELDQAHDIIEDMFTYKPWDAEQTEAGVNIRNALQNAAEIIVFNAPAGPDRSAAIRKLREARMDANSAITHGGKY